MALTGSLPTVRAQLAHLKHFDVAFSYLDEVFRPGSPAALRLQALAVPETRRIELAGGAFALEQAFVAKPRAEGFFESHRKFIDVQVVVAGEERMELADLSRLTVREAYQAERDLIIHADYTEASVLRVKTGDAAIFFPADGHMPSVRVGTEPTVVRKTVIKVPVPA